MKIALQLNNGFVALRGHSVPYVQSAGENSGCSGLQFMGLGEALTPVGIVQPGLLINVKFMLNHFQYL